MVEADVYAVEVDGEPRVKAESIEQRGVDLVAPDVPMARLSMECIMPLPGLGIGFPA